MWPLNDRSRSDNGFCCCEHISALTLAFISTLNMTHFQLCKCHRHILVTSVRRRQIRKESTWTTKTRPVCICTSAGASVTPHRCARGGECSCKITSHPTLSVWLVGHPRPDGPESRKNRPCGIKATTETLYSPQQQSLYITGLQYLRPASRWRFCFPLLLGDACISSSRVSLFSSQGSRKGSRLGPLHFLRGSHVQTCRSFYQKEGAIQNECPKRLNPDSLLLTRKWRNSGTRTRISSVACVRTVYLNTKEVVDEEEATCSQTLFRYDATQFDLSLTLFSRLT